MSSLSLRTPWLCALFAAAAASSPVIAAAQDCSNDADCGAGYRCQTDSYESCGGSIMCTPDGECTETPGDCETVTYSWCTNAICNADADCPSSMACQAQTTWQCDGGGAGAGGAAGAAGAGSAQDAGVVEDCQRGEMCEPPTATVCTEVPADSLCIPRYELPCAVANDCGGGFDCVQSTYWECSGGGSVDADGGVSAAGTSAPPPVVGAGGSASDGAEPDTDGGMGSPSYECHEVPGTSLYCQLQDLPCEADSECPDGLQCLAQPIWTCTGGGSAGAAAAGSGGAGGAVAPGEMAMAMDADGGVSDGECSTQTQLRCMPRGYSGGPGSGGGTGSGGMTGGGNADGGVQPPGDPGPGAAGAGGPASGGTGGATDDGDENAGGDSHGESDDDHGHGHGLFGWLKRGCSAGGPIGGDPLGWLALGMVTLVMRRRARRG
jgi:hypothetical protein